MLCLIHRTLWLTMCVHVLKYQICFASCICSVCQYGYEWESGSVVTHTNYKPFTNHEIEAKIGLHVGIHGVNITLKGTSFWSRRMVWQLVYVILMQNLSDINIYMRSCLLYSYYTITFWGIGPVRGIPPILGPKMKSFKRYVCFFTGVSDRPCMHPIIQNMHSCKWLYAEKVYYWLERKSTIDLRESLLLTWEKVYYWLERKSTIDLREGLLLTWEKVYYWLE